MVGFCLLRSESTCKMVDGNHSLSLCNYPTMAKALPFRPDCASMQSYANSLKWSNPTRFQGFDNIELVDYSGILFCNKNGGGYVQETSPMGTRVCRASMQYTTSQSLLGGIGAMSYGLTWVPLNGNSNNCRWK